MIQEEAERLNRFIANLLDMTRLESGAVQSRNEIGRYRRCRRQRACSAPRHVLAQHKVQLDLDAGLPMAQGDPVLLEQVLFNLLDNAAKYTPAGTTITLTRPPRRWPNRGADFGRRRGIAGRCARTGIRQILSRACRRQPAGRYGSWACDLPRLRRGDGRHDHCGQSHGPHRRCLHDHSSGCGRAESTFMSAVSKQLTVSDRR